MKHPESAPSLPIGHHIPRGARLLSILSGYENLPDAIPCGLAHCHVKHNNGFVVNFMTLDEQPGQGMIGRICGSRHFGQVDWKRHMKEHLVRQNLANLKTQMEALIEDCEDLLPQLEPLLRIADVVDRSRRTLEANAKELYRICEHACRRYSGLISYNDGKRTELRIRHRGFWTRQEVHPRLLRLMQDMSNFTGFARAAPSPQRLGDIISKLGLPYDCARQLAADLSESLDALKIENIAEILPLVNEMTAIQALRMNGSVLEVCNSPSWNSRWVEVLNLEFFQRHVKRLAKVREAVSNRREAA